MSSIPPPEMKNRSPPPSTLSKGKDSTAPIDIDIPDNYVSWTLKNQKALPSFQWSNIINELNWLNVSILTIPPLLTIYAILSVPLQTKTFFFSIFYYFVTGLGGLSISCVVSGFLTVLTGITAGYHRLWAHRAYNASKPLQYALAMAGAGAVEGSIKWWSRGHRAHHRYTDTDLDPYNAHQGFWYSHIGWMLLKPRRRPGVADVSDLSKNEVVRWQHRWYLTLLLIFGFGVPTVVPGLLWGDWKGGYFFAGAARLVFVHHVCFLLPKFQDTSN
jgi:stearoyl-CoA desaturase (delta-9 desaturase)